MGVFFRTIALVAAVLTLSCGGGGGGSTVTQPNVDTQVAPNTVTVQNPFLAVFSAAKYAGFYLGTCDLIPNAVNLETSTQVYGRLYQVVGQTTTASASLQWRIDIYDSPTCEGSAVGYIENKNTANKVTIVGQSTSMGTTVDKVVVSFGAVDLTNAISVTPSAIVIGNAIRISLPAEFFSAFEFTDIWSLLGAKLYEGGSLLGADGFPAYLDYASPSDQLRDALPLPPAPCAAKAVAWTYYGPNTCEATLAPAVSGTSLKLLDTVGPATGDAWFSCLKGEWSAPNSPYCIKPAVTCPEQTFTWTVGGNVCSGLTPIVFTSGFGETVSTKNLTGNGGTAWLQCSATGQVDLNPALLAFNRCAPIPPQKPRTTDPLQLATEKNCMACHNLTVDSIGPSFKTIADYYRGKPLSPLAIESKIVYGSIGTFGLWPMPANPQVDLTDAFILRSWILDQ
jgi:cytochrome c